MLYARGRAAKVVLGGCYTALTVNATYPRLSTLRLGPTRAFRARRHNVINWNLEHLASRMDNLPPRSRRSLQLVADQAAMLRVGFTAPLMRIIPSRIRVLTVPRGKCSWLAISFIDRLSRYISETASR